MERYLVIDTKDLAIIATSDLADPTAGGSETFETYGDFKNGVRKAVSETLEQAKKGEK